jgi:ABC-type dipeptide/oligopeptide/nickel transport system ATPase component
MTAADERGPSHLLNVSDLVVELESAGGIVRAVDGVSLTLDPGRALALVGASGSGKSTLALAVMGLLESPPAKIAGGRAVFEGRDVLAMTMAERRTLLGRRISIVFQETLLALDPIRRLGAQMIEAVRVHARVPKDEARNRAVKALERVHLDDPGSALELYPHQLSGGMRQRAMIALALLHGPSLLIADEATSALDPILRAEMVRLFVELKQGRDLSLLVITHDPAVAGAIADDIAVMERGRIIERGTYERVLEAPEQPFTKKLIEAAAL